MNDPFSDLAAPYLRTRESLRNVVRHALIARQLRAHLPEPPARILDVGGGSGHQSVPLAHEGYEVTILDPSPTMLDRARETLASETDAVRRRVWLMEGDGERAAETLSGQRFDAVLCHGVLMYLEDPQPMIQALSAIALPGAVVSVLAKNASALAMRPALEGRYVDALSLLDVDRDVGRLGVETRADSVEDLSAAFREAGIETVRWYGIRVFTDHLSDALPGPELDDVLRLELEAGGRDPYRGVARLIHLIGRKK